MAESSRTMEGSGEAAIGAGFDRYGLQRRRDEAQRTHEVGEAKGYRRDRTLPGIPGRPSITGRIIAVSGWGDIAEVLGTNQRFDALSPNTAPKRLPVAGIAHLPDAFGNRSETRATL